MDRCPEIDDRVKGADKPAVLSGGSHRFRDVIASALGWWAEAGVTEPVSDQPRDWLAAPALAPPPAIPGAPTRLAPAPAPTDLAALHRLLATGDYVTDAPPPRRRVAPAGDPDAPLMIVTDMPDDADLATGRLLTAESALFDAMLAAMGRTRATIYLAPLSPARLVGGRLGSAAAPLGALMRAHLGLVRPRALLLLGDETCRAILDAERDEACHALRDLKHDGGTVAAIATIHPRILRLQPPRKAEAWSAMRQLLGVLCR